jgi:uncharacterized protein YjbJ (UPF0337 family)
MNADTFKGNWKQLKGKAKAKWGKLTDDELTQIEGNYDQFVGKVQERYGETREATEKKVSEWFESLNKRMDSNKPS